MIDAITYEDMLECIDNQNQPEDIVGILITRPDLNTGNEIVKSLNYYHHLTSHNINFYLPGYGAYWNPEKYPDMNAVTTIDGIKWYFSNKAFVEFVETLECKSSWQYTGESELLLIPYHNKTLDFSEVGLLGCRTCFSPLGDRLKQRCRLWGRFEINLQADGGP